MSTNANYEVPISERTFDVLKNFLTINQSLLFKSGNLLRTVSPQKTILSEIEIEETFPVEFAIGNLGHFLGVIKKMSSLQKGVGRSKSDGVKLSFSKKLDCVTISGDKPSMGSVLYRFIDSGVFQTPPSKDLVLPDVHAHFTIKADELQRLLMMAKTLGLSEIIFEGREGTEHDFHVTATAGESKWEVPNRFLVLLDETPVLTEPFRHVFKVDNMRLMIADYDVKISTKGISQFTSPGVTVFVATESRISSPEETEKSQKLEERIETLRETINRLREDQRKLRTS